MAMVEKKARWPEDVWRAFELIAAYEDVPVAEIHRTGGLSYASYLLGRAANDPDASEEMREAADALGDLFAVARRAVQAWPL